MNICKYGVEWSLNILLAAIHGAEAALVEAAAQCGLDDKVVGLGRRSIERPVIQLRMLLV